MLGWLMQFFSAGYALDRIEAERVRKQYLASYGAQREQIAGVDARPLAAPPTVRDVYPADTPMCLSIGSTMPFYGRFQTRVLNELHTEVPYLVCGDTYEQSRARAQQLISALDGARRL